MDEINLLEKIRRECHERDVCKGCVYYDMINGCILQTTPECWKLNSLERKMSDIDLMVKIPKYVYDTIIARDGYISDCDNEKVGNAIKNGTPLPKREDSVVDDDKLALLEKTYADFCKCESREGWLRIDGVDYYTDVGYALEGMKIFMEVFKQRLAEKENGRIKN